MGLLEDIIDAVGDLVDGVVNVVTGGAPTFGAVPGAKGMTPSYKAAPQQFWAARTTPVNVTVHAPKARISWNSDEWRDSRLEDIFDPGEFLPFDVVNSLAGKRKSSCKDPPHGESWALTLPQTLYAVPVPDDATLVTVQSIATAGDQAAAAANQKLSERAIKKVTIPGGADWDKKRSRQVRVDLLPGRYLLVVTIQPWVSRKWDCPHGWWKWTETGPRLKDRSYMRNHCTEKCSKFYRKVYVVRVKDYSTVVQVPGSGSLDVELQPVAQFFVGDRNVYEDSWSRWNKVKCKIADALFDAIISRLTGG